jgi:hypothetical protein
MTQMTLLHPGDPFPTLTVALPEGRALRLPDALAGHYGVLSSHVNRRFEGPCS